MRFAPEYVTYVLNENFEDAKAQFRLLLAQDPDDLFFREPTWLHGPSPQR